MLSHLTVCYTEKSAINVRTLFMLRNYSMLIIKYLQ